jgi:hypothetical protein
VLGVKPRKRTAVPPLQQASGRGFSQPPSGLGMLLTKLFAIPPSGVSTSPVPRLAPGIWLAEALVQPEHVS